jgi:hypothetical protein
MRGREGRTCGKYYLHVEIIIYLGNGLSGVDANPVLSLHLHDLAAMPHV